MTPEVREGRFYETSLEILSIGRILRHLFDVPLAGFPYAHILSLTNPLRVTVGR
jgi:hypothetical protein